MTQKPRRRMKCILLVRYADFTKAEHVLQAQSTALRNYATDNHMTVVDEVSVIGSCSSHQVDLEVQRLLRRKLERNDFSVLLVTSLDRIARNYKEWMRMKHRFQSCRIQVIDVFSAASRFEKFNFLQVLVSRSKGCGHE